MSHLGVDLYPIYISIYVICIEISDIIQGIVFIIND